MGLFGAKPKLRARASAFGVIDKTVGGIRAGRQAFTRGVQANLRDIAGGRKSDLRSVTQARSADAAFAASAGGPTTNLNDSTDQAIGRARGLSRVVNATKSDFDQSLLQERLASVRIGQQQQGQGIAVLNQAGQLDDRLAGAKQRTEDVKDNARSEMLGTGLGIAADQFSNFFTQRRANPTQVGGTGAAGQTFDPNATRGLA